MKHRFQACAVAAVILSSPALAQLSAAETIGFLDLDKDGKVSRNEYLSFQQLRLSQYDATATADCRARSSRRPSRLKPGRTQGKASGCSTPTRTAD